jgi:hypothetical protein
MSDTPVQVVNPTASSFPTMDDPNKKRIADQDSHLERSIDVPDGALINGSIASARNFDEEDMKRRRVEDEVIEIDSSAASTSDKEEQQIPFAAATEQYTTVLNAATISTKGKQHF